MADETIYHQGSPSALFTSLIDEATRLSHQSGAYLPFIQCQSDLSIQQSLLGNHQRALNILQGISKLVNAVKSVYPALYFNYLNSVAYELGATGELAAAPQPVATSGHD